MSSNFFVAFSYCSLIYFLMIMASVWWFPWGTLSSSFRKKHGTAEFEKIACALDTKLSCPASRNASVLLCQRLMFPFLKPVGWWEDLGQVGTHPQRDSRAAPSSAPSPGYIQAVSPPSAATALPCLLLVLGLPDAWWHWFFPWDCFSDYDNRNVMFIHTQKIQKEQLQHKGSRINKSCSLQLCVRTGGVRDSAPANVCM